MAFAETLAAVASIPERINRQLMSVSSAARMAERFRAAGDPDRAEAALTDCFEQFACAEKRAFQLQMVRMESDANVLRERLADTAELRSAERASAQCALDDQARRLAFAVDARLSAESALEDKTQKLALEMEARLSAERELADARGQLKTADVRGRALIATAADYRSQIAVLTAAGPLPAGPLPARSAPPGSPPPSGLLAPGPSCPLPPGPLNPDPSPVGTAARTDERRSAQNAEKRSAWDAWHGDEESACAKRTRGSSDWNVGSWASRSWGRDVWSASGADLPSDSARPDWDPRFWPAKQGPSGRWHAAGYKVHVRDLPATITETQLSQWMRNCGCAVPSDVNLGLGLSPRGRGQVCLTFKNVADAIFAMDALSGGDLESGRHLTQTKWFEISR